MEGISQFKFGVLANESTLLLLRYVGVIGITERMPVRSRSISTTRARTRIGISVSAAPALAETFDFLE